MKILIVGYPRVGKTQYSSTYREVIHLDGYMDIPFKEQIYVVLEDIKDKKDWVIEGLQGCRLFRKMLQLNESLPDKVVYINPKYEPDDNHKSTRKMIDTVWKDCLDLNKDVLIDIVK